jgi:hypothetical protein
MKYSIIIILLCLSNYSYSCTCGNLRSVTDEFNKSKKVVIGKIIDHQPIITIDSAEYKRLIKNGVHETQARRFTSGGFNQYTLVLSESPFKGEFQSDTLLIRTGLTSGACGYSFQIGKKYVIYGYDTNKEQGASIPKLDFFWTDNCTRTNLYSKKERKILSRVANRTKKESP